VIILIIGAVVYNYNKTSVTYTPPITTQTQQTTTTPDTTGNTVSYSCDAGKTITAVYYQGESKPAPSPDQPPVPGGSVALTLSDGRTMTLPQTISADGTRYANADESFVFWGKGNGALVLENNQQKTYIGCIMVANQPAGVSLPQAYSNSSQGFSIRLPADYTPNASYKYEALGPGKTIYGVKFTIPASLAKGTNLSPESYISVEEIPKATTCTASLFTDKGTAVSTINDNDTTYSMATTGDAAAGNRYDEKVYAIPSTSPCVAVRYFIHYGAYANYDPGTTAEFDEPGLVATFDQIRHTLVLNQ
jgi:membrane-bound inhibitor of C-type lysozyme